LEELEAQGKDLNTLMELNVQIGRKPEAVFMDPKTGRKERVFVVDAECNEGDVQLFSPLFERGASSNKRAGLPGTLHRLSFTTHPGRQDTVVAVTARVGRAMEGVVARMAPFLLEAPGSSFSSLLLIGRPGVGKTTLLRELACALSHDTHRNVVVVDKTCEIAGDDIRPHPAIGTARWMPVGRSGLQPQVMREAVENQTPDIIICDEISTMEEVEAARSMAQRGVALVATVHGETLPELVNDSERRNLVGGQTHITLTDTSAEKRPDKRKNPAVRLREPVFVAALELHERERWIYHPSVRDAIDAYYAGEPVQCKLLEPGRTVAAMAIPARDAFIYCLDCGRLNTLCPQHAMSAPRPLVVDAGSPAAGFSFGAPQNTLGFGMGLRPQGGAGGGGGGHRRRPGAWSGIQRSGNCYSCGEYGHFAFECSRR